MSERKIMKEKYNIAHINALDYDSLIDLCPLFDAMIGCWGCNHWTEHDGRSLGCRVLESNFDSHIKENTIKEVLN